MTPLPILSWADTQATFAIWKDGAWTLMPLAEAFEKGLIYPNGYIVTAAFEQVICR